MTSNPHQRRPYVRPSSARTRRHPSGFRRNQSFSLNQRHLPPIFDAALHVLPCQIGVQKSSPYFSPPLLSFAGTISAYQVRRVDGVTRKRWSPMPTTRDALRRNQQRHPGASLAGSLISQKYLNFLRRLPSPAGETHAAFQDRTTNRFVNRRIELAICVPARRARVSMTQGRVLRRINSPSRPYGADGTLDTAPQGRYAATGRPAASIGGKT